MAHISTFQTLSLGKARVPSQWAVVYKTGAGGYQFCSESGPCFCLQPIASNFGPWPQNLALNPKKETCPQNDFVLWAFDRLVDWPWRVGGVGPLTLLGSVDPTGPLHRMESPQNRPVMQGALLSKGPRTAKTWPLIHIFQVTEMKQNLELRVPIFLVLGPTHLRPRAKSFARMSQVLWGRAKCPVVGPNSRAARCKVL